MERRRTLGREGRLLVIGEAPAPSAPDSAPFGEDTRSGRTLAMMLGFVTDERMRAMVDLENLFEEQQDRTGKGSVFHIGSAREAAAAIEVRAPACLLVGRVRVAFGLKHGYFGFTDAPTLHDVLCGRGGGGKSWNEGERLEGWPGCLFWGIPHPSGVNRWWNDRDNRHDAFMFFSFPRWLSACSYRRGDWPRSSYRAFNL